MANQRPTADDAFGPAPLPIDETFPPEEEAERVTPRHEGAKLDLGRRVQMFRYRTNQQAVFFVGLTR